MPTDDQKNTHNQPSDDLPNSDLNDAELKKAYNELSFERPTPELDAKILAEARDAVAVSNSGSKTRWRPGLATAASITIVVILVVQYQSLYWDADQPQMYTPSESMTAPKAIESKPAMAVERVENDKVTSEPLMRKPMAIDADTGVIATISEDQMDLAEEASHAEALEAKAAERQLHEEQAKVRQRMQAVKKEKPVSQDLEILLSIQKLIESGQIDDAKRQWAIVKSRYPEVPDSEPLKSQWLAIKAALE